MKNNASKYGIIRMGIFGSVARQEQNENSDIDIYIEGELKGFFALSGIKNDLEELLGCSVDIPILHKIIKRIITDIEDTTKKSEI